MLDQGMVETRAATSNYSIPFIFHWFSPSPKFYTVTSVRNSTANFRWKMSHRSIYFFSFRDPLSFSFSIHKLGRDGFEEECQLRVLATIRIYSLQGSRKKVYIYIIDFSHHGAINSICRSFRPLLHEPLSFFPSLSLSLLIHRQSHCFWRCSRLPDSSHCDSLSLTLITLGSFRYVTRLPTRRIVVLTVS